jgi:hypothetical protein
MRQDVQETEEQVQERIENAIHNLSLQDDPFIPTDLGFTESIQRDENGGVMARVYTKDGFNIAKPVDLDHNYWVVMDSKGETRKLLLSNAYTAIIVLQACGMPITFDNYYLEGEEEFAEGIAEFVEGNSEEKK